MKGLWPFTFYILMFAGVAFLAPFLVLYYQSLGFRGAEIGLLTGITPAEWSRIFGRTPD